MDPTLIFLSVFFVLLALGVPVAFMLIVVGIALAVNAGMGPSIIVQRMIGGMDNFPLLAIPFFMLAGEIMNQGTIARRLVELASALVGRFRGGLAQVNILSSMFFGGISGSSVADTAAIGSLLIPAMVEEGYDVDYAAAVTAASSTMGIIIPPSIPMVLYGIISGVSIIRLFIAGIIPGILIGLVQMLTTYLLARKRGFKRGEKVSFSKITTRFKSASGAFLIPIIIVGGILSGAFTPTEAAVIAAATALFLAKYVYHALRIRDLAPLFAKAAITTATVMFLVGVATGVAWLLTISRVPFEIIDIITAISENQLIVLLMINVFLLVIGCVMDLTPALLVLTPIFRPILPMLGIDPVFFGVMMIMNLGIGLITPPIGTILYIACGIGNIGIDRISRAIIVYVGAMLLLLLVVILNPGIVLFLPNLILG